MAGKLKAKRPTTRDKADAARLQRAGTHGDTVLAHINPQEAGLLDVLADGLPDGGGRNPTTGLLSFGMSDGESGRSGGDSNPGGVGGGPAGGNTGGGIGGNTADGTGGLSGGYGGGGYDGSYGQQAATALGDYYRDTYINGMVDNPYAPKDTWERVWQEMFDPSGPQAPGRYGMPNAIGPGIFGTVAANFGGPMMSGMMGLGAAMGRAQSPAQQAASMAESQATGSRNSTGNDAQLGHRRDALGSPVAGSGGGGGLLGDGTAVSPASTVAPGGGVTPPTVQPGQLMDTSGRGGSNTLTGLPQPVQNLLADYIWRGRQGSGFGW